MYSVLIQVQKLAQWYRQKYKHPEATKLGSTTFTSPFLDVLAANLEKAPQRLTPFHRYLKMYYQSRVKDEYVQRLAIAKNNYDNAMKEEKENGDVKEPVALQLMSEVGREFWLRKTNEFRKQIAMDAKDAHVKEVEEWEALKETPETP